MKTVQKAKGLSLDRLLNDPMALFGALGALGALVVVVWVAAGSGAAPKDDEAGSGAIPTAPTGSSKRAAATAEAGSSLAVAKLKDPAAKGDGAKVDALRDAGGASADGEFHGTLGQLEARQRKEQADKEAADQASRKAVPTEVAGQEHVPGMAPDSTRLAGAPGAGGFGAPSSNSNPGFVSANAGAAAKRGSASPDPRESGPLLAGLPPAARGAAPAGQPFLRSGGGSGPGIANFGAPRRAVGGQSLAPAGLPSNGSTGGTDIAPGETSFARPGAASSGGTFQGPSGEGALRSVSAGAPPSIGGVSGGNLDGLGGGRGALMGGDGASASARPAASMESRQNINDDAARHLDEAQKYRAGVVMRLVSSERSNARGLELGMSQASSLLGGLDQHLAAEARFFSGSPAAVGALNDSRQLIGGSADSLKPRIDSALADMKEGAWKASEEVPSNCDLHPVVQQRVFVPYDRRHPGARRGAPLKRVGGVLGYDVLENRTQDLTGAATGGQDQLQSATRRAANVRRQALAGVTMVDPEFAPALQALQASDPKGAARLASDAGLIKDDLNQVAADLPDRLSQAVSLSAGGGQGRLQDSAQQGYQNIKALADQDDANRLKYPDGAARDKLMRDMAEARTNSREAVSQANALTGGPSDSMFALTEAGRSSTYALDQLCDGYHQLQALSGQAK